MPSRPPNSSLMSFPSILPNTIVESLLLSANLHSSLTLQGKNQHFWFFVDIFSSYFSSWAIPLMASPFWTYRYKCVSSTSSSNIGSDEQPRALDNAEKTSHSFKQSMVLLGHSLSDILIVIKPHGWVEFPLKGRFTCYPILSRFPRWLT